MSSWTRSNLTICGPASGRARLYADGKNAQGKGLWVIDGSNIVIENVEFHGATVPDQNGAGIRAEGNGLVIRNCGFYDNENGILGPDQGELTVERSEFARNGVADPAKTDGYGRTHNIYVGSASKLTVRSSFFHEARIGHNLKSRARETHIENSYFMDGTNGTASYEIDVPDGGLVFLRGNLLQKGPDADNPILVNYGSEHVFNWPVNTLTMIHNTLVSTYSGGSFISAASFVTSVTLTANLFAGTNGPPRYNAGLGAKLSETNSVVSTASNFPKATDVAAPSFWPTTAPPGLMLAGVPDAQYTQDAPLPFAARMIDSSAARKAGALQAPP